MKSHEQETGKLRDQHRDTKAQLAEERAVAQAQLRSADEAAAREAEAASAAHAVEIKGLRARLTAATKEQRQGKTKGERGKK